MAGLININEYSKTPKYKQIVNSVIAGIEKGELEIDDKLPSVNRLLIEFDISRDTVVKAYEILKEIGIIDSVPGKGYYIRSKNYKQEFKVGKEVGIISYNETPLKEILLDGITIISTDFEKLGQTAAQMILENRKEYIANPFRLMVRNSL